MSSQDFSSWNFKENWRVLIQPGLSRLWIPDSGFQSLTQHNRILWNNLYYRCRFQDKDSKMLYDGQSRSLWVYGMSLYDQRDHMTHSYATSEYNVENHRVPYYMVNKIGTLWRIVSILYRIVSWYLWWIADLYDIRNEYARLFEDGKQLKCKRSRWLFSAGQGHCLQSRTYSLEKKMGHVKWREIIDNSKKFLERRRRLKKWAIKNIGST